MINEIQTKILEQINTDELLMANFKITYTGDKSIVLTKGKNKVMVITYQPSNDLYDLELIKLKNGIRIVQNDLVEGIYFDQLQEIIEKHFDFDYVMEEIWF